MSFDFAELQRLLANLLMMGLIHQVDHANQQVKANVGELITGWLPWPADIGRNYISWRPLRVGTQVLLACPDGDPTRAVIVQVLYTTELAAPVTEANIDVIQFNDGTNVSYDSNSKALVVNSAGTITINASGNVSVNSDADLSIQAAGTLSLEAAQVKIKGPVTQTGGDMTSDGVSAQHHITEGVKAGVDKSGEPVK